MAYAAVTLDLILAFILCPRYGIEELAIANACTFGASNLTRLTLVKRFVDIRASTDRQYGRLLGPAAAAFLAMAPCTRPSPCWVVNLAATGLTGAIVYGLVYLAVGVTGARECGSGDGKSHPRPIIMSVSATSSPS